METFDVSNKYYVYVLYSLKDYGLYIGFTTDLKKRLTNHSKGRSVATKHRTPLKLIHYEYFISRSDAKAREVFLKSGYGREQLTKILKNTSEKCLKFSSCFVLHNKHSIEDSN